MTMCEKKIVASVIEIHFKKKRHKLLCPLKLFRSIIVA